VLTNIIAPLCLLSLGGIILGAGLFRLSLLDRRRMEYNRQNTCQWHHWQALKEGTSLVCALCGKRCQRVNPSRDKDPETIPSENIFP
jgi:hypothetical protein